MIRDFLTAASKVWEDDTWGNPGYMVTRPVTLEAMLRVCADLARVDAEPEDDPMKRWQRRLSPWSNLKREFRAEGFYERFPAKGQVERVARVHRELDRYANIEPARKRQSA